jgi:hypothetical protein
MGHEPLVPLAGKLPGLKVRQDTAGAIALRTNGFNAVLYFRKPLMVAAFCFRSFRRSWG